MAGVLGECILRPPDVGRAPVAADTVGCLDARCYCRGGVVGGLEERIGQRRPGLRNAVGGDRQGMAAVEIEIEKGEDRGSQGS